LSVYIGHTNRISPKSGKKFLNFCVVIFDVLLVNVVGIYKAYEPYFSKSGKKSLLKLCVVIFCCTFDLALFLASSFLSFVFKRK
jgi:hypothetical protein